MERPRRAPLDLLDEIATLRGRMEELQAELARAGAAPEFGPERVYRLLVEHSLGLMCVHDLEGELLYVNPAAADTLQWTSADGIGRNLREYLAPEVQPLFEDYLARIRRNSTDSGLLRLVAKDGTERIWSYRNVKIDAPGLPACVLGHALDVTEATRTRQALHEANRQLAEREARHQSLVEGSPVGIGIDQGGIVRFANRALARLHGVEDPADLVGRPLATLVAPRELARVEAYQAAIARGERVAERIEVEHVRRDGSAVWVERWSSAVAWAERPAVLSTFVDVSDRKRLEARLRQMERVEAVERLAGGVAHHINNLMTIVLGSADRVLREPIVEAAPRVRDSAQMIRRAGHRTATLVRQLLAFSRTQILRPARLDLSQLLSDLAPQVREMVSATVTVELALEGEPWAVEVDPAQLEYAVLALVANARDAMPHGGRLVLRTDSTTIEPAVAQKYPGLRPGAYAVLTVQDSGVGMTEEVTARLFEPFFSTKPVGAGTGLALASVYGTVKQHGGYIAVDSRPGVGTTVQLYFPRASQSDPLATRKPGPTEGPAG